MKVKLHISMESEEESGRVPEAMFREYRLYQWQDGKVAPEVYDWQGVIRRADYLLIPLEFSRDQIARYRSGLFHAEPVADAEEAECVARAFMGSMWEGAQS